MGRYTKLLEGRRCISCILSGDDPVVSRLLSHGTLFGTSLSRMRNDQSPLLRFYFQMGKCFLLKSRLLRICRTDPSVHHLPLFYRKNAEVSVCDLLDPDRTAFCQVLLRDVQLVPGPDPLCVQEEESASLSYKSSQIKNPFRKERVLICSL